VIGPYFFKGNLNGHRYVQFFQNDLPLLLEEMPLDHGMMGLCRIGRRTFETV
jgi:hypothetical protein